jgi:hypothetical protein
MNLVSNAFQVWLKKGEVSINVNLVKVGKSFSGISNSRQRIGIHS